MTQQVHGGICAQLSDPVPNFHFFGGAAFDYSPVLCFFQPMLCFFLYEQNFLFAVSITCQHPQSPLRCGELMIGFLCVLLSQEWKAPYSCFAEFPNLVPWCIIGLGQKEEGLKCLDGGQNHEYCSQMGFVFLYTEHNRGIISLCLINLEVFQQEELEGFQFGSEKIYVLTWWVYVRSPKWQQD